MNRKVLGRGLSALLGDENRNNKEEFLELDLDLIEPNADQPRTNFAEADLEELTQSIRINGVIQPIIVRRKDSRFQIVAGERRWRASQKAGLKKISAIVKEVANEKLLELALIENIQRQELNPMEEARAYKNLVENLGLTQENIAERVGKNRTVITTFLRLLKLPSDIQKLVEEEKLTAGHARALLMTDNSDIQRNLAKKIIDMSLSVREAERTIKNFGKKGSESVENNQIKIKQDANTKAAETKLKRHLGTQVQIHSDGRGTGGKIEIEYYSESDLDRIYELILKGK
jgi:ParB family chromosome partitioning protein